MLGPCAKQHRHNDHDIEVLSLGVAREQGEVFDSTPQVLSTDPPNSKCLRTGQSGSTRVVQNCEHIGNRTKGLPTWWSDYSNDSAMTLRRLCEGMAAIATECIRYMDADY
jgi:hypothetical protein